MYEIHIYRLTILIKGYIRNILINTYNIQTYNTYQRIYKEFLNQYHDDGALTKYFLCRSE